MSTQTVTFKISDSKIFADVIDNQKELVEALIGLIDFADAYGSVESQNAVNKARASIDKALSPHKGEAQREHEPHARDAITWTPDTGYVFSQPKETEQEPVAAAKKDEVFAASIEFIGTLTGMTPPPIEVAPPEVFKPFRDFTEKVCSILATPPQRKPLTDEQFKKIKASLSRQEGWDGDGWDLALKEAIEAAHGIK